MPDNTLEDRLLTTSEAAAFLGYVEGTVRNKVQRGEIPVIRLGRTLRFRLSDLRSWVDEQAQTNHKEAA